MTRSGTSSNRWRFGRQRASRRLRGAFSGDGARVDAIDATISQVRRLHGFTTPCAGLLHPVLHRLLRCGRLYLVRLVSTGLVLGRHTPEFLFALRERGGLGDESQVDRGRVLPVLFWVDTISTFPFALVLGASGGASPLTKLLKMPRLIKALRVLKMTKLTRAYHLDEVISCA